MPAMTPEATNHAGLAPLASRFVKVAALPWEKTRHPGVETRALVAEPQSGLLTVLTKLAPGAAQRMNPGIVHSYTADMSAAVAR